MSPPRPRGAAWFLGAVCVLTSCTPARTVEAESGRPQPSPATSFVIPSPILAPRPFTQDDLGAIVLGRRDTPPGTEFASQYSVDQTIDQFASDAEELTALRQDRFVGAHTALFVPKDQLGDPTLQARHGATFVQSIAAVFETPEGADSTLLRYVANLRAFELTDEVRIDAEGLRDTRADPRDGALVLGALASHTWIADAPAVVGSWSALADASARSRASSSRGENGSAT